MGVISSVRGQVVFEVAEPDPGRAPLEGRTQDDEDHPKIRGIIEAHWDD